MNKMEQVIMGGLARDPQEEMDQFVEGKIKSITSDGAMFTVPDWDGGTHVFGPAPWPVSRVEPAAVADLGLHDHDGTKPPAGSRCLVVFVGTGVDRPWILGWW